MPVREHTGVEQHPAQQHGHEADDERPGAAHLGHAVGEPIADGRLGFLDVDGITADRAARLEAPEDVALLGL